MGDNEQAQEALAHMPHWFAVHENTIARIEVFLAASRGEAFQISEVDYESLIAVIDQARRDRERALGIDLDAHAEQKAMTVSDARPPSDTGATGWHVHANGQGGAWRDDHHPCENPRPVLVVDPAEARDTVLRAVHNAVTRRGAGEDWDTDDYQAVTNDVLAALAGQEQP